MTLIRKLALALSLALLSASYSNSQEATNQATSGTNSTALVPGTVYTTGNIVQPTTTTTGSSWTGAVYQDNLTCWYSGDPGYCGPNAIVRPGNLLNFSYGSTYVYQQQHINTIVPSGSGLQVNGYNFGFYAKNGNGWDGGGLDQLTALVRFWDNTGSKGATNLLYGTSYNLNYKFDWTYFNYNETFTKPLSVPDVGLVQYGFIGKDNNFWAGPYGPEIYNISFNVKYSVDPCASNPLYSPTCKGYLDALAKLVPTSTTTVTEVPVAPATTSTTVASPTGTATSDPVSSATSTVPTAPASSSTAVATTTPSATNPQPRAGEVTTSGSKPTISMTAITSILSKESARVGATEKSTVQLAVGEAQKAAEQATQQAESVAATLTTQSIAGSSAQSSTASSTGPTTKQTSTSVVTLQTASQSSATSSAGLKSYTAPTVEVASIALVSSNLELVKIGPATTTQVVDTPQQQSAVSVLQKPQLPQLAVTQTLAPQTPLAPPPQQSAPTPVTQVAAQQILPVLPKEQIPTPVYQAPESVQLQLPAVSYSLTQPAFSELYKKTETSSTTDADEPRNEGLKPGTRGVLNDYINEKPLMALMGMETTQDGSIKRNAQPNEVAGGVDIASIATQPKGYDVYSLMTLKDTAFYKVEDIYKNQQTVDNVRVLRGLQGGSDRLHQDMVDQQYKLGK